MRGRFLAPVLLFTEHRPAGIGLPRPGCAFAGFGILTCMEERELHIPSEEPLIGWRLFRVRRSESGFMLSAPLIHNPGFEPFPSRTIEAICYQAEHPAPAPGCRCGLYAAVDGTLDSLSGYLHDSAHDRDPPVYAEVGCTGRVFVDSRGVRAQRIEILRLAAPASLWPDPDLQSQAVAELRQRYCVEVCELGVVPQWVVGNVMLQGAPAEDAAIDLDALLGRHGLLGRLNNSIGVRSPTLPRHARIGGMLPPPNARAVSRVPVAAPAEAPAG